MPKAVLHDGVIQPLEPLPPDWREGQELRVEKADETDATAAEITRDFAELADLCSRADPDDDARLAHALQKARQFAKDQVRRSMGLA